jgi:hypothetical protein
MMADEIRITKDQACRFMLEKHGLIGSYKFTGKQGVLDFIDQAGCIQFDPIDVCGKNAELVLQSRVKSFRKAQLSALLYEERSLIDYFDKNLAIIRVTEWPCFQRIREAYMTGSRSHQQVNTVCEEIRQLIRQKGPLSAADIDYNEKVHWYWSDTRLSRAALETMYFRGDLVVHHKNGTTKHYDLAENCIGHDLLAAPDPHPDEQVYKAWRVLRRIGAIGLLWNRASDAWLNIWDLKAAERNEIFRQLLLEDKIIELSVDGIKDKLYCLSADRPLLEDVMYQVQQENGLKSSLQNNMQNRCELLAPLDNLLWDRKLISALFGFDYKWEIYTPVDQRKYGYYVLPLLFGDRFVARLEVVCDRRQQTMIVKNIWFEEGIRRSKQLQQAISSCLYRFAAFNDCQRVDLPEGYG